MLLLQSPRETRQQTQAEHTVRESQSCFAIPGQIGLLNLGNTCFFNSVMQVLGHCRVIKEYFATKRYERDIFGRSCTKGRIAKEFAYVVENLHSEEVTTLDCKGLMAELAKTNTIFEVGVQQDAHEALTFLLQKLHDDLKSMKIKDVAGSASQNAWVRACEGRESFVMREVFGQFRNILSCNRHESENFENFSTLILDIPERTRAVSLIDCLKSSFSPEEIPKWNCVDCKKPRTATKRMDISHSPNILIIQLKRFKKTKKNVTEVIVPLTLDMKPFCHDKSKAFNYNLFGSINHEGSLEGGHYKARSLHNGEWFEYNDEHVTSVNFNQCDGEYLLFYEMVSVIKPN